MTDFLFARWNLHNVLISIAKKYLQYRFFFPVLWCTKNGKFHFRRGKKPRDQKQETGNDCDIISSLQASRKTDFSDIFLLSYKQRTFVPFFWRISLAHNEKMTEIRFPRSLKSGNDVTIILSVLFLVWRFCIPPEEKFHVFGTSKDGEEKSISTLQ